MMCWTKRSLHGWLSHYGLYDMRDERQYMKQSFKVHYQVFSFVNSYINELDQLPKAGAIKPASVPSSNVQQRWIPPSIHTKKINVDGVVARHRRGGAVAAICQDHSGAYLGSSAVVF